MAALAGLALVAAACGDDGGDGEGDGGEAAGDGTFVYFVEGNMSDALAEDLEPGIFEGIRGTIPGAEVPTEFLDRMEEQNPDLPAFTYGPETYDAVIILALAAQAAGSDQADEVARAINGVTRDGTECTTFEECKGLLDDGEDIAYQGQSGTLAFAQPGERTSADYGLYPWTADNTVDTENPEFYSVELFPGEGEPEVPEDASEDLQALAETGPADPSCSADSDGTFSIGGILAETGDLGDILGAPQIAAANLAVDDINGAGGVLGEDLAFQQTDGGDEQPDVASDVVADYAQEDVDAVLGASATGVSLNVIDAVVGSCTLMMSPSNTGTIFTTYDDDDLYFRTAASDILQGQVLADIAIDDGAETMVIMARQDDYGTGLAESIETRFTDSGGEVLETIVYDPQATDFTAEVDQAVAADADSFVLISFDEGGQIMNTAFEAGLEVAQP